MADMIQSIFKNKKVNPAKLLRFGFAKDAGGYSYNTMLADSGFEFRIHITEQGEVSSALIDPALDEPYTLHLVEGAVGSFVGTVRTQYEAILHEIARQCFAPQVFKFPQTEAVIEYVRTTYGSEPEFLWEKFAGNAVWRRQDTGKWYGVLLTVSKRKLGLAFDDTAEILDIRIKQEELAGLIDNKRYFPGYHMNKKHWLTIILDDSVELAEIYRRIDNSYLMATK